MAPMRYYRQIACRQGSWKCYACSAGHTVGRIAAQLNRSKQTVSAQKVAAMRKLGLANDAALFIYLQESGMS